MIAKNGSLLCDNCGHFISNQDYRAVTYTPYGSYGDIDEPDPHEMCGACWSKLDAAQRKRLASSVWRTPTEIFPVLGQVGERLFSKMFISNFYVAHAMRCDVYDYVKLVCYDPSVDD